MITVDCKKVEHLKHDLAVFVSDWIAAIPAIKLHEFVLSPIGDETLQMERTVKAIKEYFASIGETANYAVLAKDNIILIEPLFENTPQKARQPSSLFECVHCGFVTPYEVMWQNHIKLHYI